MCVAFFFVDRLGDFVLAPTMRALPPGESLILTKLGEGFAFYLDVALIGGFALYLISIGIAWIVGPKAGSEKELGGSDQLRLVVGAVVADQARRAGFGPRRTPRSRRALI